MLPSQAQAEPQTFDQQVRQPGNIFLNANPNPSDKDWKGKEYWQRSLIDMRRLHNKICAYSSTWIPHSTGSHSIDHFIAKKIQPGLAYEWSNYRYVSSRFNSRKGLSQIVDPYKMTFNWFVIDFSDFFIKPNFQLLTPQQIRLANETIDILHFNDDEALVDERVEYYKEYLNKDISFEYLERSAPFIAFEINRQNLKTI